MRHHRDWLKAYLEYTENSEAPEVFHLWTGLSTIASTLKRKCFIDQGKFQWHSNMFLFFIAPPGVVSKSTTADIGTNLLRQIEGVTFGPSIMTWQAMVGAFVAATEEFMNVRGEVELMCPLTVVASELGTFLDPTNREMIDLLVSLWDSRNVPIEKLTKGGGLERVENPWINLIGCTTPSWVSQNLTSYFSGGGFSSRTLYIYTETKRKLVAYPGSQTPFNKDLERTLVEDLQRMSLINGPYTLTPEAIKRGEMWYEELHTADHPFKHDERFMHYLARKQAHVHKAAMLRAASLRDERHIMESDLLWGIERVSALEPNMVKAFGGLAREEIVNLQMKLLEIMRVKKKLKKQALYQEVMFSVGYETYTKALEAILGTGMVQLTSEATGLTLEFVGS